MHTVDLLITGDWILTMDERDTQIRSGAVAVAGDRIAAVGPRSEIESCFAPIRRIDLASSIILPGLVNGHTHAAMTCFRGIADDLQLMEWLNRYIFPAEARNVNEELAYWGSLLACAEMIKSGTTTFSDMYIFEEQTARAARKAGMRCLLGEVLFDFPSPSSPSPRDGLAYTERMLQRWAGDPLVSVMVEPHALYTCSPELLKASKALADRYRVPLATHLLENRAEAQQLTGKLGMKAVHFLRKSGLLDERFIAFHGVAMDEEDMRIFADHGCKVVHNPESNMKLASGIAPVAAMLGHGIVVGLGTDGCASNNNLDLFGEMDTAAKLAKAANLDPTVLPARAVLRMATCEGARVLGLGDQTGTLAVGRKADLCILDINQPHLTPMYTPYSHLVFAARGADVDTVVIDGKVVMQGRKLLTIDEREAMRHVRRIALGIRSSLLDR
jgi:5-methylthioadenosine/S-adenosylhomocysteine deaminase